MRRILCLLLLAMMALLPGSIYGQMRGAGGGRGPSVSHGGPGFRAASPGFRSSGPVGFRAASPASPFSSPHPYASTGRSVAMHTFSPGRRVFVGDRGFGFRGDRRFGFHRFHRGFSFNRGCFSGFCNSLFFAGSFGFGAPYYPLFPEYYYAPAQPPPVIISSDNGSNPQLAVEMQRLTDEVEELRNNEDLRKDQERSRSESRRPADPPSSLSAQQPAASTTFVFRDGHKVSAQNYAIAGQTLWILSEHAARKISLADVDAAATEQVNAANGIEFHLPGANK